MQQKSYIYNIYIYLQNTSFSEKVRFPEEIIFCFTRSTQGDNQMCSGLKVLKNNVFSEK